MNTLVGLVEQLVQFIAQSAPADTFLSYGFNVRALLAVLLVSPICGAIGSQVVGNRMAFFSDALAHCAFAGFAVAFLVIIMVGVAQEQLRDWMMLIMVLFGVGVGLLIALVNETTGLPSDTVIGVFFAGAIGLGAVFARMAKNPAFNIESFLFGDPQAVRPGDLIALALLAVVTVAFLASLYNPLVLASINPSLALSRNVPVRACRYLFVMLLGLVVNLCLFVVGTLLINALLIVPAATAANFCRNLRELFWFSILLALVSGVGGLLLSWELNVHFYLEITAGGSIVMLTVLFFIISMVLGPARRNRAAAASTTNG